MTRLEKLKLIDNEIQEIQINNDLAFFTHILPNKLNDFLTLTYFNSTNETFHYYLEKHRKTFKMAIEISN